MCRFFSCIISCGFIYNIRETLTVTFSVHFLCVKCVFMNETIACFGFIQKMFVHSFILSFKWNSMSCMRWIMQWLYRLTFYDELLLLLHFIDVMSCMRAFNGFLKRILWWYMLKILWRNLHGRRYKRKNAIKPCEILCKLRWWYRIFNFIFLRLWFFQ